jgi:hypothetical protein
MTPEEFVEHIVKAHCEARVPLYPHSKLTRGESRSVASQTEDVLAYYLVLRIPSIERVYINQPLTRQRHPPASRRPRLGQPSRGKRLAHPPDGAPAGLTAEQRLLLLDTWRRSGLATSPLWSASTRRSAKSLTPGSVR